MENVITVKCDNCGYSHDTNIGQAFKVCIECKEGYDMPEGVECENLDGLNRDELKTIYEKFQDSPIIQLQTLAEYARNKAIAMFNRERGTIKRASYYEKICETFYNELPQALKW